MQMRLFSLSLLVSGVLLQGCGPWKAVDADGDGFSGLEDCWDDPTGPQGSRLSGAQIHVGAADVWYDGIDQDCSGGSDYDQDGDGHDITPRGDDCLDVTDQTGFTNAGGLDPAVVYPGATEVYFNGTDEDCGGAVDGAVYDDGDQDGDGFWAEDYGFDLPFGAEEGDCDDSLDTVNPAEDEVWYDGVDEDCSGGSDFDQDGDGAECADAPDQTGFCQGDCDDTDPDRFPDASVDEIWYNGTDENCDGNDGDQDGDGVWAEGYPFDLPDGTTGGDCIDDPAQAIEVLNGRPPLSARDVYPGADETWYDSVDADCDGADDFDQDEDGFRVEGLNNGSGSSGTDCGDTDAAIFPGADEVWYDGVDQDCSDTSDFDQDGDGTESDAFSGSDCDDTRADVEPGNAETCATAYDDNCDGHLNDTLGAAADPAGCTEYLQDADTDGYGAAVGDCLCVAEADYTIVAAANPAFDCDDGDGAIYPGAQETCATDGVDDDCDGLSNEQNVPACTAWYADDDGDDYGDPAATVCQCDASAGYPVADNTDCDDGTSARYPGFAETCDDVDNDCDSVVDDGLTLYYSDVDGDSYGDINESGTCHTDQVTDGVTDHTDCDDGEYHVYPGALEICDLQANDCTTAGAWTEADEANMVTEFSSNTGWESATPTNLSWNIAAGSVSVHTLSANNRRINVCHGTYYQAIKSDSSVTGTRVEGIYGAADTVLTTGGLSPSGAWTGPLVRISNARIEIAGLTLSQGTGTSSATNGGAVLVSGNSGNQGSSSSPNLLLEECVISGSSDQAGGGIAVGDSNNVSQSYGYVRMLDTLVTGNSATSGSGGGALVLKGILECESSSGAGTVGFNANTSTANGGAVYISGTGSFISEGCDFGTGAGTNNGTVEVDGIDGATPMTDYTFGDNATFTCTVAGGCL